MSHANIPGYTFGTSAITRSPITLEELDLLKKTLLFGSDDVEALRMSKSVLADQVEGILDVWYGFVGANPHLLFFFGNKADGKPDARYLDAVRKRFGRWILDTADAQHDQAWLDWQHELGLRHHRSKKNVTDGVASVDHIHLRYVLALVFPITATLEPFLAKKGHPAADVARMKSAWTKAVLLQVILWSHPYVKDGDF